MKAMNANRMLGITTKGSSGSTEKLSSGYRINRAADDAAGLAISEKMRKQMRGLTQASENAEDGISCVQTAEGALAEVQDMLQRMNELCVQAANGTNSISDRQYIQDEIDQMVTEIDRVSETTKFNELYLLKGDKENGMTNMYVEDYRMLPAENDDVSKAKGQPDYKYNYIGKDNLYFVNPSIATASASAPVSVDVVREGDDITPYLKGDGGNPTATPPVPSKPVDILDDGDTANPQPLYKVYMNAELDSTLGGKHLEKTNKGIVAHTTATIPDGLFFYDTETNTMIHVAPGEEVSKFVDDDNRVKSRYRYVQEYANGTTDLTIGKDFKDDLAETSDNYLLKQTEASATLYDSDGKPVSGMALYQYFDDHGNYTGGLFKTAQARAADKIFATEDDAKNAGITTDVEKYLIDSYITTTFTSVSNALEFDLHVGSDSDRSNKITTEIDSISAASIGIDKLHSNSIGIVDKSGANATDAIDIVGAALIKVSTQRSLLGAVQNRLEHTINNLDNVVENTTDAESSIRDTDMADEMVQYSNNNILLQAGQSMLAQANQSNQGVLTLLQG